VAAHLHDLGKLKQACFILIKANMAAVMMSAPFWAIKRKHPSLWKETRTALGLPADDDQDEEEDEDEDDEAPQAKRARKG
jgi:hypothetical protein